MPRLGGRGACVLALAVLLAPACTREVRRSTTPPIVDNPSASRDTSLLLTEADVRAVAGLEDAVAETLADAAMFENPDPRGPCGAPVPPIPMAAGYGRAFRGDGVIVVEILMPASAARASVDAMKADARASCGPYTSRTNLGDVQQVGDITILGMPAGCTRCVGWLSKVTVGGAANFGGVALFESGGSTGMLQVVAAGPVPGAVVRDLLDRALARLGA